jgi:hypothetical protein
MQRRFQPWLLHPSQGYQLFRPYQKIRLNQLYQTVFQDFPENSRLAPEQPKMLAWQPIFWLAHPNNRARN